MRALRQIAALSSLVALAACQDLHGIDSTDPTNLEYALTTETSSGTVRGVLLTWEPPRAREAWSYVVYGRPSTSSDWYLIGITTSMTFHDAGAPQRQYYVAARDEDDYEFGRSRTVTIEYVSASAAPSGLAGVSMNGAIQLSWSGDARASAGTDFLHYRILSTFLLASGACDASRWVAEGTTISTGFLAGGLTNGITRCFAVTAVTRTGAESAMSPIWTDTPRHDARHVMVDAFDIRPASSAFLFHDVVRGQFGAVVDGSRTDADFRVERDTDGRFTLRAVRDDVRIAPFGAAPVADLHAVDLAPATGYIAASVMVAQGHAYVFRIVRSDGPRYGVVRIAYVTEQYLVLDWAYQTGAGNPELQIGTVRH